ncbi:hypothetical protein GOV14_06430 [Candidatus Pacearchaeota archaeon]|nr:hypothetical protein [Candidatus Pacearchaeota archaeon]
MEQDEFVILAILFFLFLRYVVYEAIMGIIQEIPKIPGRLNNLIHNLIFQLVMICIFLITLIYLNYKLHVYLLKIAKQKEERKKKIKQDKEYVEKYLNKDLEYLTSKELESFIEELGSDKFLESRFWNYKNEIKKKVKEAEAVLIKTKNKEKLEKIYEKNYELEKKVSELEGEKRDLEAKQRDIKQKIEEDLDIHDKKVFKKEDLSEKEIEVLKEEGFSQVNEYCILENKIIPVLVKQILNHSATHTFLVWNVKQLLLECLETEKIIDHDTRDADITFKIRSKKYAIEVETGSLLRKKKQLKDKIEFLKNRYGRRWMIVVSNRDLYKAYSKFGLCTQRRDMRKKLKKLMKI